MSSGLSMASSSMGEENSKGAEKASWRDLGKSANMSSRASNMLGGGFSPRNIASLFGSMVVLERYFLFSVQCILLGRLDIQY